MKVQFLMIWVFVILLNISCSTKEQGVSESKIKDTINSGNGKFLNDHPKINFKPEKSTDYIIIDKDSLN